MCQCTRGGKIASATQDKTMLKPGPADKVYTLVPHMVTENVTTAGDKVPGPRGRPRKVPIPSFALSQKEGPLAEQQSKNMSQSAFKQHIPVFNYAYLHLLHNIEIVKRLQSRRVWDEGQNFSFSRFPGALPPSQPSQKVMDDPTDAEQTGIQAGNSVLECVCVYIYICMYVCMYMFACLAHIEET